MTQLAATDTQRKANQLEHRYIRLHVAQASRGYNISKQNPTHSKQSGIYIVVTCCRRLLIFVCPDLQVWTQFGLIIVSPTSVHHNYCSCGIASTHDIATATESHLLLQYHALGMYSYSKVL